MSSPNAPEHSQDQPRAGRPLQLGPGMDFQALNARTLAPDQAAGDMVDLRLPGLTDEIRWTLLLLRREIAIEAFRWGGSPTAFLPISWARWMEMLELNSINAIKTRLARLEDMALIEVIPCERGSWGSSHLGYRLGIGEGTEVFRVVMEAREQSRSRLRRIREAQLAAADTSLNPGPATTGITPGSQPWGGEGRLNEEMAKHGQSVPQTQPWPYAWQPTVISGKP